MNRITGLLLWIFALRPHILVLLCAESRLAFCEPALFAKLRRLAWRPTMIHVRKDGEAYNGLGFGSFGSRFIVDYLKIS